MAVLFSTTLLSSAHVGSEPVYRWTDRDGQLTFSAEPPPPEVTTEYEEVGGDLRSIHIQVDEPEQDSQLTQPTKGGTEPIETNAADTTAVGEAALSRQNYCHNLRQQLAKLEAQLNHADGSNEFDHLILSIQEYEQVYQIRCSGQLAH